MIAEAAIAIGACVGACIGVVRWIAPRYADPRYPVVIRPYGARATTNPIYTEHMIAQQLWRIAAHASHYFGMTTEDIASLYRDMRIKWFAPTVGIDAIDARSVGFVGTKRALRGWAYRDTVCVVTRGDGAGIEETAFTHEVLHWLLARIRRNPDTAHADSDVWQRLEWIINTDETVLVDLTGGRDVFPRRDVPGR